MIFRKFNKLKIGPQSNEFGWSPFFNRDPEAGQICAYCEKTDMTRSALLFDRARVTRYDVVTDKNIPVDFTFGSEWDERYANYAASEALCVEIAVAKGIDVSELSNMDWVEILGDNRFDCLHEDPYFNKHYRRVYNDILSKYYRENYGANLVFFNSDAVGLENTLINGSKLAFQAVFENIAVPVENIPWKCVIEFRSDKDIRRKYRDFHLWLKGIGQVDSLQHLNDLVGQRLDDYNFCLRKHGIETAIGAVAGVLAFGSGATALKVMQGNIGDYLYGGLMVTTGISIWVAKRLLAFEEVKRGQGKEVAIVYDLHKFLEKYKVRQTTEGSTLLLPENKKR